MTALELHTSTCDHHVTISVIGAVTHDTAGTLREHLRRVLDQQPGTELNLDLRCCTAVDTDGLLTLDVAHRVARKHQVSLRVSQVPPLIARAIHQHNLSHLVMGGDRDHGGAEAHDVPEADALEQRLSAKPEDTQTELDELDSGLPMEANPADVAEQQQPVPLDDDGYDTTERE